MSHTVIQLSDRSLNEGLYFPVSPPPPPTPGKFGRFLTGNPRVDLIVDPDAEDELQQLVERVLFADKFGKVWAAEAGMIFDGASIPRVFWPILGSPLTGDFRRAAIIHDALYRDPMVARATADLVFYQAMRCDGVGWFRAQAMYRAVRQFGKKRVLAVPALVGAEEARRLAA